MPDTFDNYKTNPASVTPLVRAVCDAMPKTTFGVTVGPILNDKSIRALLDAIAALEA